MPCSFIPSCKPARSSGKLKPVRYLILLSLFSACAPRLVAPAGEIAAIGLSSMADRTDAEVEIVTQLQTRVRHLENGVGFLLERSGEKPAIKLAIELMGAEVAPKLLARPKRGFIGKVVVERSEEELARLAKLKSVHLESKISGKDLAKGLTRAERDIYRTAAIQFAEAEGRKDKALSGRLYVLNLALVEDEEVMLLAADVAVDYTPKKKIEDVAPTPASAPSQAVPAKKVRVYEDDEPAD